MEVEQETFDGSEVEFGEVVRREVKVEVEPVSLQSPGTAFTFHLKSEPLEPPTRPPSARDKHKLRGQLDVYIALRARSKNKRWQTKAYACEECGKQFPNKSNLVQHIQSHMVKKLFNCQICTTQFKIKYNYRTHYGYRGLLCEACLTNFPPKRHFRSHQRIRDKFYTCYTCVMHFTDRSYLVTHRKTHHQEKSYSCEICNKVFTLKSCLINHQLTHLGEKFHDCVI